MEQRRTPVRGSTRQLVPRIQGHMRGENIASSTGAAPESVSSSTFTPRRPEQPETVSSNAAKTIWPTSWRNVCSSASTTVPMSVMEFGVVRKHLKWRARRRKRSGLHQQTPTPGRARLSFAYWEYHGTQISGCASAAPASRRTPYSGPGHPHPRPALSRPRRLGAVSSCIAVVAPELPEFRESGLVAGEDLPPRALRIDEGIDGEGGEGRPAPPGPVRRLRPARWWPDRTRRLNILDHAASGPTARGRAFLRKRHHAVGRHPAGNLDDGVRRQSGMAGAPAAVLEVLGCSETTPPDRRRRGRA